MEIRFDEDACSSYRARTSTSTTRRSRATSFIVSDPVYHTGTPVPWEASPRSLPRWLGTTRYDVQQAGSKLIQGAAAPARRGSRTTHALRQRCGRAHLFSILPHYHLAEVLVQLGDADGARTHFE
jgi:hypothetical protein